MRRVAPLNEPGRPHFSGDSQDSFAPFRTVRGVTKAEAFDFCNPVPEPPTQCGRLAR